MGSRLGWGVGGNVIGWIGVQQGSAHSPSPLLEGSHEVALRGLELCALSGRGARRHRGAEGPLPHACEGSEGGHRARRWGARRRRCRTRASSSCLRPCSAAAPRGMRQGRLTCEQGPRDDLVELAEERDSGGCCCCCCCRRALVCSSATLAARRPCRLRLRRCLRRQGDLCCCRSQDGCMRTLEVRALREGPLALQRTQHGASQLQQGGAGEPLVNPAPIRPPLRPRGGAVGERLPK